MPSRVVDWKTITEFVTEAFVKYGVPEDEARICTASSPACRRP